jgi:hypothetical protein
MRRPRSSSGSSASSYNQEEREQNNSEAEQNYNQEEQNSNQEEHIHDEQAEMDQLLQSARKARHDEGRKPILASCLEIFYLQDEVDPSHLDIVTLNLTPEEMKQVLNTYRKNPYKIVPISSSKKDTITVTEQIHRLSGEITYNDAKLFQSVSDMLGNEEIDMVKFVDEEAQFTISSTFEANKKFLILPPNYLNWYTEWTHAQLAKLVTSIWGQKKDSTHTTLKDDIRQFDMRMDEPIMNIMNVTGEQKVCSDLNRVFLRHPLSDYDTKEKQVDLLKILNSKIKKHNIYRQDMEALPDQPTTCLEWMIALRTVREAARHHIHISNKYRALTEPAINIGKLKKQRTQNESDTGEFIPQTKNSKRKHNKLKNGVNKPHVKYNIDWSKKHCQTCGRNNHLQPDCQLEIAPAHADRNCEKISFNLSTKGKLWIADELHGPFCNTNWMLDGTPRASKYSRTTSSVDTQSEYFLQNLLTSVLQNTLMNNSQNSSSDYLLVNISLPNQQTILEAAGELQGVEEVLSPGVVAMDADADAGAEAKPDHIPGQALLDTGCLVGDCMSQKIVDMLNASHLVVNINTTICSGFDNNCSNTFPSLIINISFINEITHLSESFQTRVLILPKSPIDIIIGRKTIKNVELTTKTPSHFSCITNLNLQQVPVVPFGEKTQEMLGCITSYQDRFEGRSAVKGHAHTCKVPLTLISEPAGMIGPLVNTKQTRRGDRVSPDRSLCLCGKALPPGSRNDGSNYPTQYDKAQENLTVIAVKGLNDTPLLAPVLMLTPQSDTPPLSPGKTDDLKHWCLQEDGSYKPVFYEKTDNPYVSSMIHLSDDKSCRRRVSQTWGIIATLIKQQEQLNESQPMETVSNSQDVQNDALTSSEDITTAVVDNDTDDIDNILDTEHDVFNDFIPENDDPSVDVLDSIKVEGSPALRVRIRILLEKHRAVFATTLSKEPADIPPFDLMVDKDKWESYQNRGPPRVQSPAKQAEILRQVDELLKTGIIEPSTASYYSQVILASKPDDTWRFCIDFRSLNDCTQSASWPIPNIQQMFARLGTHHSNIFGVMDLTAGYHQAPVGLGTRIFLAFICFCGIFQFCRLPFGPKRAPSYFQQMMSSVVLVGLLYFICEMYLDDCIVHANGEDQFIERLDLVLGRFGERNIFLKPSKCGFGMPRVEYCGKEISENGLCMSKKKIQKVLDFPKPQTAGQMKQFVGLINYFHDYVEHHSEIMKPLHDMIQNYQKKTKGRTLVWTNEGIASFYKIIAEIEKGHTMFFPREDCPVFLLTDASDYGIGAYCFQLVDNTEQPVAFVSKALSSTQYKWSIIQKEAYSIFYALRTLKAILRDRHFTLQTDNRGLRFMRTDANPMVYRWLVDTQEYDYAFEDILGINNPVADGFSRLVENNMPVIASLLPPEPIPEYLQILIGKVHNSFSGHHGLERTLRMLTTPSSSDSTITLIKKPVKFLRSHIRQYIKLCACCQKMSMIKIPIHSHPFTTSRYYPMECLNIDYVGPFPDKGYVMVISDTFTRWIELFYSPEATGHNAALNLLQHFGRFGAPTQIQSDRGSHFVNEVIKEFLSLVGTQHCLTLAYSSQQNAIVERVNKEINRHIRALTFDTNSVDDYALTLPIVQRILNAAYSDHTKISASQLLFGNAINLDRGLFLTPLERPTQDQPLSVHASKMLQLQDEIMKKAREVLTKSDDIHMASFPNKKPTEFLPDSFVLVKYRKGSAPTRMHTQWKGPLRVISNERSEYILLDLITNKQKPYHASDMKPFIFDPLKTDPQDIARRDYLEFFVEKILDIMGDTKRVSSLQFHIKWLGFNETHNSWEPWKNLRDLAVLHEYLKRNNLGQLIPKKFKTIT